MLMLCSVILPLYRGKYNARFTPLEVHGLAKITVMHAQDSAQAPNPAILVPLDWKKFVEC